MEQNRKVDELVVKIQIEKEKHKKTGRNGKKILMALR